MGTVCCQNQSEELPADTVTLSLTGVNSHFKAINIKASNQLISKQKMDLLIVFTGLPIKLTEVPLLNKLPQSQLDTIKEFAQNTAQLKIRFKTQDQVQQDCLEKTNQEEQVKDNNTDQWTTILIDNPIQRLQIGSILLVKVKVWDGTQAIPSILQGIFKQIKTVLNKYETIGLLEIGTESGIPLNQFHKALLQTFHEAIHWKYNLSDPKQIQAPGQTTRQIEIQEKTKNPKVKQEQASKNNPKNKEKKAPGSKMKNFIYLTHCKQSVSKFAKNLKGFDLKDQEGEVDARSDYF